MFAALISMLGFVFVVRTSEKIGVELGLNSSKTKSVISFSVLAWSLIAIALRNFPLWLCICGSSMVLLSLLWPIIWNSYRENVWRRRSIVIFEGARSYLMTGKGFQTAWCQLRGEIPPCLQGCYEVFLFSLQSQTTQLQLPLKEMQAELIEMLKISRLQHRQSDVLRRFLRAKKIKMKISRKKQTALAQIKGQSGILALFFGLTLLIYLFSQENPSFLLAISALSLFFLGQVVLFLIERTFKWRI